MEKMAMKLTKDIWNQQSKVVIDKLRSVGYSVSEYSDADDRVDFSEARVHINSRCHPETRFYTLLHEYGHVDICVHSADQFEEDHPLYYRTSDGRTERSHAGRVSILAEEIEAWKRGRWFARKAGLKINESKYDKHMTDALMSYINWAADKPQEK